jgi:hypothetical protein
VTRKVLLCLIAAAFPSLAADPWLRITTPDFELYTSAGEKKGRETILHFEQVRAFFLKASPVKKTSEFPVRIVQFGTEKEFSRYSVNQVAAAYYTGTPARDYIVMSEAANANASVAIHEYMHLVVRHSGLHIPLWLNEGWADVYSTLRPMGNEAAIGDLLPGRVAELERNAWMDFKSLTSVAQDSPEYNEAARAGIFYAESWALTHMLYFAPEYEANFSKFVMALHQGHSAAEACRIAWNRTAPQVFADLKTYLDRKKIYGRAYAVQLAKAQEEPSVAAVSDFDERLMLADLLAATGRREEAKKEYEKLQNERPDSAGLAMSAGYFAWQNKDAAAAFRDMTIAFEAGETDARMCLQLYIFMQAAKRPPAELIPVLERALKSKPDYPDAQAELGLRKIDVRDFSGAIATLMAIPTVRPEEAASVFCSLSLAFTETGDLAEARSKVATCSKWAKTPADKARVDKLTAFIDARAGDDAAVHIGEKLQAIVGVARSIDCSSNLKRLLVDSGGSVKTFELPSQGAIEMLPKHGGTLQLACGPLKPTQIGVEFAPPRNAMETSAGIVRALDF